MKQQKNSTNRQTLNGFARIALAALFALFMLAATNLNAQVSTGVVPAAPSPTEIDAAGAAIAAAAAQPAAVASTWEMGGVTAPPGMVFIPGSLGGHLWLSDQAGGFCRLDPTGLPLPNAQFQKNLGTCVLTATKPGQPVYQAATKNVYVPDSGSKSQGVLRFTMNTVTETITTANILAAGFGAGNRPVGAAIATDGNLYVSYLTNGNITRFTTPAGATQTATNIAKSSDGKRVRSLAASGTTLFLAEGNFATSIGSINLCTGSCVAVQLPGASVAATPFAVFVDATTGNLYIGNTTAAWVRPAATGVISIFSNVCNGDPNVNDPVNLSNVSAFAIDAARKIHIGDDFTMGIPAGDGRICKATAL
jgi:streptogramin lyase